MDGYGMLGIIPTFTCSAPWRDSIPTRMKGSHSRYFNYLLNLHYYVCACYTGSANDS